MTTIHVLGVKLKREEKGATAVEYGIMVALIAVVIITVVGTIGTDLLAKFTQVANAI
ncbi:Flp family type IVb pilin [Arthrobacter ginkgonis]